MNHSLGWRWKADCYRGKLDELAFEKFGDFKRSDVCLRVFDTKEVTIRLKQPVKIRDPITREVLRIEWRNRGIDWLLPYKLAHLVEKQRDLPELKEISHLCDDKRCINVNHMNEEPHKINMGRKGCHAKIRHICMTTIL